MTRYTNLGRKRTHLEAGFSADNLTGEDLEDEPSTSIVDQKVEDNSENTPASPPKMKRRRTNKKEKISNTNDGVSSAKIVEKDEKDEKEDGETMKEAGKVDSGTKTQKRRKKEPTQVSRSEKRRLKRQQERFANTTCFACREKGHAARDCPKVPHQPGDTATSKGLGKGSRSICYRCGSSKHTLSRCKKPSDPDNPLPFASCYVCSGKGHIASSCPRNKDKGVYPNGGCCKLCGETSHLAKDCPTRKQVQQSGALLVGTGQDAGADEDDFHILKRVNAQLDQEEQTERRDSAKTKKKKSKSKVTDEKSAFIVTRDAPVKAVRRPAAISAGPPPTIKKKVVVF